MLDHQAAFPLLKVAVPSRSYPAPVRLAEVFAGRKYRPKGRACRRGRGPERAASGSATSLTMITSAQGITAVDTIAARCR